MSHRQWHSFSRSLCSLGAKIIFQILSSFLLAIFYIWAHCDGSRQRAFSLNWKTIICFKLPLTQIHFPQFNSAIFYTCDIVGSIKKVTICHNYGSMQCSLWIDPHSVYLYVCVCVYSVYSVYVCVRRMLGWPQGSRDLVWFKKTGMGIDTAALSLSSRPPLIAGLLKGRGENMLIDSLAAEKHPPPPLPKLLGNI